MSWIFSLSRCLDLTRKKILFIVDGSLGPKWASTLFATEVKSNHLVCYSKVYTAQICATELEVWTKKLCTVAHQCWEIEKEKLFGCFLGLKACCSLKDIQTACIQLPPRYWGCHKDKEEQGTLKPKRCLLPVHVNINFFFSSSWHTKFLFFLNITAITEWTDWKTPKELPSPKKGIILHFWWFRQLVRVCIKFGFQIVKEHFLPLQLLVSHSDNFPV